MAKLGRKQLNTVEYFPHWVNTTGSTKRMLRSKFGAAGVAAWWEMLEVLAASPGHYYEASEEIKWQDLILSRLFLDEQTAEEFFAFLTKIKKIDFDLWVNHRCIWCQSLVDNLERVYAKRKNSVPEKPSFIKQLPPASDENHISGTENTISGAENTPQPNFGNISGSVNALVKEKKRKEKSLKGNFISAPEIVTTENGHYGAGNPGNDDDDFSLSLLTQNGISKKVAVSLVRKFSAERIAEQTEFTIERVKRGELEAEAVPAYLVRGIMENYRAPKGFTSSMQQRKKAEAAEAAERSRKAAETAKLEAEQKAEAQEGERAAELAAYYDALPEYEQEEIHQLVIDTMKAENSLIYGRYLQELEKGNNWDQVKLVRLVYLDIMNKILEASWQR